MVTDLYITYVYAIGIQTQSHHLQRQMKNQITLENRQVNMSFGVVLLFFIGYALRLVLNLNELYSTLNKEDDKKECPARLPSWIHVRNM